MKLRFRILILSGIFLLALIVFYSRVRIHSYNTELQTVKASQATLPTISFRVNGVEINQTLGYTFAPQAQLLRESITPIGSDLTFEVLISEHESVIKRLVCEVTEVATGTPVEKKEVKALKKMKDGRLSAGVILTANYADDTEYTAKITLTTNDGRDIFFYTRIIETNISTLAKNMDFVAYFHSTLLNPNKRNELEKYLETSDSATGADYAHVTITDSIETVGYGDMNPREIASCVPTITEYNSIYVCTSLDYRLQVFSNDAEEQYHCNEKMRFRCQSKNNILFNYDRTMQVEFDGTLVSINKNQIKMGLMTDTDLKYLLSDNKKYLMYVCDGDLWEYDMKRNVMVKIFSFDSKNGDFLRYQNYRHDYHLISIEDNGDADFVFYGYITRGQYEGRVGILYYRYFAEEGRIAEMMFVPVDVSYDILKEEFGKICYMNEYDEFYFTLYDSLYLYRTLVHDFSVVAEHLPKNYVLFEEEGILVYQKEYSDANNTAVYYYDLENRKAGIVETDNGDRELLLGTIDGELIYGLAHKDDVTFRDNGTDHVPMYEIIIEKLDGTVVKRYQSGDVYFSSAEVIDNAINILRCRKIGEVEVEHANGTKTVRPLYENTDNYNILKSTKQTTETITLSGRTTNLMHREYYMNLPEGFKLQNIPETETTVFTVLTGNTSVRVGSWIDTRYYVESYGRIIMVSGNLGSCIAKADETNGAVMDGKGTVLWKRGIKAEVATVKNLKRYYVADDMSDKQAILQMFLSYKGAAVDARDCNMNEKALLTWLTENILGTGVDLAGATLSEVLYFVSEGRPVCVKYNNEWALITGYAASRIDLAIPARGRNLNISVSEAKATIEKTGVYYSYID